MRWDRIILLVGLYRAPPENAILLCGDHEFQIQALDRTAPLLAMQIGVPDKCTRGNVRHGTRALFAALGGVIG
ncbi:hypothetical protein [Arthrobacter sp. 35W]|uniref:hypothetical protein n=1 Tax=Arthrobacter sp. 35W TaxID=1132441 RepID=UPI00047D7552|nr:hypothetical protein [Arthrobacter sp. 35W]